MPTPKFWMVYVEGGDNPIKRHETEQSAREEASRLALKVMRTAFVLEVIAYCVPAGVSWETL